MNLLGRKKNIPKEWICMLLGWRVPVKVALLICLICVLLFFIFFNLLRTSKIQVGGCDKS
jgi:hypothetical protein